MLGLDPGVGFEFSELRDQSDPVDQDHIAGFAPISTPGTHAYRSSSTSEADDISFGFYFSAERDLVYRELDINPSQTRR